MPPVRTQPIFSYGLFDFFFLHQNYLDDRSQVTRQLLNKLEVANGTAEPSATCLVRDVAALEDAIGKQRSEERLIGANVIKYRARKERGAK